MHARSRTHARVLGAIQVARVHSCKNIRTRTYAANSELDCDTCFVLALSRATPSVIDVEVRKQVGWDSNVSRVAAGFVKASRNLHYLALYRGTDMRAAERWVVSRVRFQQWLRAAVGRATDDTVVMPEICSYLRECFASYD
eukprot:6172056-Pleurochrysis_carterae.AAC.2